MTDRRLKQYRDIDGLRASFAEWSNPIRKRLEEFSAVPHGEYFYELVYCLLTPQSSAVNAGRAVETMRRSQRDRTGLEPVDILANRAHYIRFHKTKSERILRAREQFPEIALRLSNGATSAELREWLVDNVNGLGWKEASHFLRNIGHRDLAILDRHILRNLRRHGVIRSLPRTLTQRHYFRIERAFKMFADAVGISMDELDLYFWSRETGEILK
jgi:N-glycosylase/DNA lyase